MTTTEIAMPENAREAFIRAEHVRYEYVTEEESGDALKKSALNDVSFSVAPGEFIGILGQNGSGKSTLARHINALLAPTSGTIWVDGKDTKAEENRLSIRQQAGMVFQNPDNQIVASVVEEDVGFGPENLGIPTDEIWQRVEESLDAVGMLSHRLSSPTQLSGGQKQRVAIAGVMAMQPACIILDEATAMLDPAGKAEVLRTIRELNQKKKVTVLWITHDMEEVVLAHRIFVLDQGRIALTGTPREVFAREDVLQQLSLALPSAMKVAASLRERGLPLPQGIMTEEELTGALEHLWNQYEEGIWA